MLGYGPHMVINSQIYRNSGNGISVRRQGFGFSHNNVIAFNGVGLGYGGGAQGGTWFGVTRNIFYGNTLALTDSGGTYNSPVNIFNNVFYNNTTDITANYDLRMYNIVEDPKFKNTTNNQEDFTPMPDSYLYRSGWFNSNYGPLSLEKLPSISMF
jgi:hypothetical protein